MEKEKKAYSNCGVNSVWKVESLELSSHINNNGVIPGGAEGASPESSQQNLL